MIENGWFEKARRVPSPNFNQRPIRDDVSLLVIHNISLPPGVFGGDQVERFFTNRLGADEHPYFANIADVRVSAHAYIRRQGEIVQFVPFHQRAWHAGRSEYQGRPECNDYAIGVELEGTDTQPYTDEQYDALAMLTAALLSAYPQMSSERITGHSTIAPQRKTDPGPSFDWDRFHTLLQKQQAENS